MVTADKPVAEGDGQPVRGIRCCLDAARHGPEEQALQAGGDMLEF